MAEDFKKPFTRMSNVISNLGRNLNKLFDDSEDQTNSTASQGNTSPEVPSEIESLQSFIDNYRDALSRQRDTGFQNLDNARRNAFQNIMSGANSAGMMYSNFPERSKIAYDTNTYMPARNKIQSTYQTGLDSIRNNVVNAINTIADLKDAAAANKTANDPKAKAIINDAGDYSYALNGPTQFRNNKGENIRFGTAAKRAGYSTVGDILEYAANSLRKEGEADMLNEIWELAKENGYTGFDYNVGDDYQEQNYNFLDDSQQSFLNSLGLKFQ